MAADTEAALVKISDSALVGKGTGKTVTAGDSAAETAESTCELIATFTANYLDSWSATVNWR